VAGTGVLPGGGLDAIQAHVQALPGRFLHGARGPRLALLTPDEPADRGALGMVRSTDAPRLVGALAKQGILCSTRDGSLRVSLHYYNTEGDVDMVLAALDRHPDLLVHAPN